MSKDRLRETRRTFLKLGAGAAGASVVPVRSVLGQTVAGSLVCEVEPVEQNILAEFSNYGDAFVTPVADSTVFSSAEVRDAFRDYLLTLPADKPLEDHFSIEDPSQGQLQELQSAIDRFQIDYETLKGGGEPIVISRTDSGAPTMAVDRGPLLLSYLNTVSTTTEAKGLGYSCLNSLGIPTMIG